MNLKLAHRGNGHVYSARFFSNTHGDILVEKPIVAKGNSEVEEPIHLRTLSSFKEIVVRKLSIFCYGPLFHLGCLHYRSVPGLEETLQCEAESVYVRATTDELGIIYCGYSLFSHFHGCVKTLGRRL